MSTPATIQIGNTTFFQSHDGYPEDVIPELEQFVQEARKTARRNPDFPFTRSLIILMKEAGYEYSDCNGFPADFAYEITENGEVKQL